MSNTGIQIEEKKKKSWHKTHLFWLIELYVAALCVCSFDVSKLI